MSKKSDVESLDLEKTIMAKVTANEIAMKPKWLFIAGSLLMMVGLVSISIAAVFLTNLTLFLLRQHGPMGQWRLLQLLSSFPLWVPFLAALGIVMGILLLRRYEFSYKNNFWIIVGAFFLSILISGFVIDYLGLNSIWARQGPMRRLYQQLEGGQPSFHRGRGRGWGQSQGVKLESDGVRAPAAP